MKGAVKKLSAKQDRATVALLSSPTIREAAETVGVGETTLFRWLQNPVFQEAYQQAKQAVVRQAITRLQQVTGEAVDVLREVMTDPDSPASSRVTAARTVLDMALRAVELEDLESRVTKLERERGIM